MKHFVILSALLTAFSVHLISQPVLSQSDIGWQIGDSHVIDSIDFVDMSNQVGPNMTWNLNDLEPQGNIVTSSVVDPSETENPDLFPESTVARIIALPEFTIDQYFSFDGSSMQHHGTSLSFGSQNFTTVYTDPEIAFPTPMTYNDSGSDTYDNYAVDTPGNAEGSGTINWDVPGYGTLLVNGETYTDVLMYRFVREDVTTTTFGGFTFTTNSVDENYAFMAAGFHYPIVIFTQSTIDDGFEPPYNDYQASLLISQTNTGLTSELEILPDLHVYPNPSANGSINLEFTLLEKEELSIQLFDLNGRLVYSTSSTELPGQINMLIDLSEDVDTGIYLLQIRSASGQRSLRIEVG